jgi:rod shape determining protein RodA
VGVAALLFWHVAINVSMVSGIIPVVGVTLPLISYGGSSILTIMVALGLVMNVSVRRFAY